MRRVNKGERARLSLTLNGRKLSGEAEPRMLLSDFLRHVLGATGTHVGCEHGVCGCCTVQLDGAAVRSCLTLAMQAEGRDVKTVESLAGADGKLNKLQQAFQNNHALQCGFCTPGILMSRFRAQPQTDRRGVGDVLSDTSAAVGYAGIVAAVLEAAQETKQIEEERMRRKRHGGCVRTASAENHTSRSLICWHSIAGEIRTSSRRNLDQATDRYGAQTAVADIAAALRARASGAAACAASRRRSAPDLALACWRLGAVVARSISSSMRS